MSRWEPNARGRLELAALELFAERGFDQTTVVEIATRAGLVERTFFRHFIDKREALFWGYSELQQLFATALANAPDRVDPIVALVVALEEAAALFPDRPEFSRKRRDVIAANVELQERELHKLALIASAMTGALRRRGVAELTASLTAEAGIVIFRIAYDRWISRADDRDFPAYIRETFSELRAVIGGR